MTGLGASRPVLVTGAQGLLGRHLVARFRAEDPGREVVGVGRSPRLDHTFTHDLAWRGARVPAPLPPDLAAAATDPGVHYQPLDLADHAAIATLVARLRPSIVVHAAAALRDEPLPALLHSNVESVAALVEALGAGGDPPPTLVVVSSGSVYGRAHRLPHREDDPCWPIDLYAASKRSAEDVSRILGDRHGISVVVARVFNLVGPGLQDRHLPAALAGQLAAISLGQSAPVVRMASLRTTRDFVDVADAAAAVHRLAALGQPGCWNVASGRETPVQEVFDELVAAAALDGRLQVELLPERPADLPRSYADVRRLREAGHTPTTDLHACLRAMLDYYRTSVAETDRT